MSTISPGLPTGTQLTLAFYDSNGDLSEAPGLTSPAEGELEQEAETPSHSLTSSGDGGKTVLKKSETSSLAQRTAEVAGGSGTPGDALHFTPGSSQVVELASFVMPPTGTIEFWFNSDASTWNAFEVLLSKRSDFIIHPNQSTKEIALYTDGLSHLGSDYTLGSIIGWHHLAWTIDGVESILYIDGVAVKTDTTSALWGTSSAQMNFGGVAAFSRYFDGALDNLIIWNTVRTPTEISDSYNGGNGKFQPATADIVLMWRLDDGSGSTATDTSGNGNDGSLVNSPAWETGIVPIEGDLGEINIWKAFDGPEIELGDVEAKLTIKGTRVDMDTYLQFLNAGDGIKFKEGTDAIMGQATMVGGTVTVSTTKVTSNSRIFYSVATPGGTQGHLSVGTITAGTSFVLNSTSGSETSTLNWIIFEPT